MTVGLKAIETRYKGYRMRSRLEARWAVFFDALGIAWDYEKEGFEIEKVGRYLPDFWLPNLRLWVEVKPDRTPFDSDAYRKAHGLMWDSGYPVFITEGVPSLAATGQGLGYDMSDSGGGVSGVEDVAWAVCRSCNGVTVTFGDDGHLAMSGD